MSVAFAAFGLILCGFSLARRRVIIAILLLCGGWVLLSLSSGYLLTAAMMFLALALSFHSTWQSKRYLLTLIGAIVVSLPLLILYPLVLSRTHPEWFDIWFNHYSLGVFGGFPSDSDGLQPALLSEKLAVVYPACLAAGGMDAQPHAYPR